MASRNTATQQSGWENLTWSALEDWCGERSLERGRDYFRSGRVTGLSISDAGDLLATVQGTQRYVTTVSLVAGAQEIDGLCTCPIGGCCKHSVAVILAYLDALEKKVRVPIAGPDDPRWARLNSPDEGVADDDAWTDDEFDEEEIDEPPPKAISRKSIRRAAARRQTPADRKEKVRAFLAGWSADRLVDLVLKLAADDSEIRDSLEEQAALQTDDVGQLIRDTRKEIRKRTAEEAWENQWDQQSHLPDYQGVERRLERLFETGQFDALLDLGQELFDRGQEQVERSDDEGETASAITRCLAVVARAVPDSSRPAPDQVMYCITLSEADDYELSAPFADVVDRKWPKKVWSAVADGLLVRRQSRSDDNGESGRWYGRRRQNYWIITALERAGRAAEVLPFVEAEAPITHDYPELVTRLIDSGRVEDARRWALEGIAATKAQWRGISGELHGQLRRMAERANDWPLVAAYDARPFFEHPGKEALSRLVASARRAGLEDAVRAGAMYFAETGKRPTGRNGSPAWPLPEVPDPPARKGTVRPSAAYPTHPRKPGPSYRFLIDLAIEERRLADALRWYDGWAEDKSDRFGASQYAEPIADAVRSEFPERALNVYRQRAEHALVSTADSSYREPGRFLRKMKETLDQMGRSAEWQAFEAQLREQYKRRRNFIQLLDRMARDQIIGGHK
jgi:uncharacterized Zn finger protein